MTEEGRTADQSKGEHFDDITHSSSEVTEPSTKVNA
jgi:hypothetical protein